MDSNLKETLPPLEAHITRLWSAYRRGAFFRSMVLLGYVILTQGVKTWFFHRFGE